MLSSSPRRPAGGMRRLWLRLAAFCAPLASLWVLLEWGMDRVPDSHSLKRNLIEALAAETDTVILGASEAYYGIAPQALSGSAFNLANTSQSLYYDDQLMRRLLPRLPGLRRVIVPVSYFTLYFQLFDHEESWRQYQFYQGWGIPPARAFERWDVRMWSRVALYTPRVALQELRKRFRGSLAPEVDGRGWYRVPEQTRYDLGPAGARGPLALHHSFMHLAYAPANEATLEHLVSMLRQRDIDVVLLTMPVWPTYLAGTRAPYWERTHRIVDRLSRQYGARYLSFANEPRLTADDFMDCDHLSARGALHFTALLDAALGPPGEGRSTRWGLSR